MEMLFKKEIYVPVLLALGTLIVLNLTVTIGISKLKAISAKTHTYIDDLILNILSVTKQYFIIGVSLYVGFQTLELDKTHGHYADKVFIVLLALQSIVWMNEAIRSWIDITIRKKNEDPAVKTTLDFLGIILKFAAITTVVLFALNNLGVNVSTFIAGLGVGGIAIALATQNILGDLFSSLSIVLDKPFVVGDYISLGAENGTIERIGLKTTRIRSLSGEQIIVSNSNLLQSKIRNFKRMQERRVGFQLRLKYSTDIELLKKVPKMVEEIIRKYDKARFDRAHFLNYGASSLEVEVVYFCLAPEYIIHADLHQKILFDIGETFKANGIEFALPAQSVYLEKQA